MFEKPSFYQEFASATQNRLAVTTPIEDSRFTVGEGPGLLVRSKNTYCCVTMGDENDWDSAEK
jgi:hypothetical protein